MFAEIINGYSGRLRPFRPYANIANRAAWDGLDGEWRRESVRLGEDYLGFDWGYLSAAEYMEYTRSGDRVRYESRFFARRRALDALVLAECVENEGRFLDDIINGIFAVCEESAWNLPAHNRDLDDGTNPGGLPDLTNPVVDLFACETGAVLATALYLLEPVLSGVSSYIGRRVRAELERRIFKPYLDLRFWWMGDGKRRTNNWTIWCTQNVLLSAFLSGFDGAGSSGGPRLRALLEKACRSADYFLDDYGEDGCCSEGAGYYRHAGLCLYLVMEICGAATGGAFAECRKAEKIRHIAAYIYHVNVTDHYYVNFADCSASPGCAGTREYLFAKSTGQPDMMRFAASGFRAGGRETLLMPGENNLFYRLQNGFCAAEIKACPADGEPAGDIYYPSTGLYIARDEKMVLAVKAGNNGDSHNHNDVGSFTVYKEGRPLFIDVGVETYSRKTFSEKRYEIWTMQSAYHNLPVINGYMQEAGKEYRAESVRCSLEAGTMEMELGGAWPRECGIRSYRRTVRFRKGREIVVKDRFSWTEGTAVRSAAAGESGEISDREARGKKSIADGAGLPERTVVLSLMTYGKPCPAAGDGRKVLISGEGSAAGEVEICGAHVKAVEAIPITDSVLRRAWKHEIYRILVEADGEEYTLRIR